MKVSISETTLMLLFFAVVILAAIRHGLVTSVVAAVMSILAFDFFLVEPYYTFHVFETSGMVMICGMLLIGIGLSWLIAKARSDAAAARAREKESTMLYRISQKLAGAAAVCEIADFIVSAVRENFGWDAVILVAEGSSLVPVGEGAYVDEKEIAVAAWAFTNAETVGYDTNTLHSASFRFIPIKAPGRVLGVLGVKPADPAGVLSPDTGRILGMFADLAGLAMGRFSREMQ